MGKQSANIETFREKHIINVDLSKLLLEDARHITSLKKVDPILLHHHRAEFLFQFGPLILILLIRHNHCNYNA